jgi:hypothetical protein
MLIPSIAMSEMDKETEKALKYASLAFYKQTGLEKDVRRFEKAHINRELRDIGGWIVWSAGVYQNQIIIYRWEFK